MESMRKMDRIKAALNCQEVDRVPIGLWSHHSDIDQDPVSLAEAQVDFMRRYDLDFIKLMPFGNYSAHDFGVKIKLYCQSNQPSKVESYAIKNIKDWDKIEEINGTFGTLGKQVLLAKHVMTLLDESKEAVPFIQTIFSPLTTAYKIAGDRTFNDMRDDPERIHRALQAITNTTISFIKANIEIGVSGFFFATQLANHSHMSDIEYDEFGVKYDLRTFEAFKDKTFFNVLHIHSFTKEAAMFEKLVDYPANCINWHDRWAGPSLQKAREVTTKCLMGGINEENFLSKAGSDEVYVHVREALESTDKKGLILGPGCTIYEDTPITNYYAARLAIERYGYTRNR